MERLNPTTLKSVPLSGCPGGVPYHPARISLILALAILFLFSLGCTTLQQKQVADFMSKGATFINDNTADDSPLKPHTKAMANLAKENSEKLIGKPETPLAPKWNPGTANKAAKEIVDNYSLWGKWAGGIALALFLLSRGLKATGLYLPPSWLNKGAKFLAGKLKKPQDDVKKPPEKKEGTA